MTIKERSKTFLKRRWKSIGMLCTAAIGIGTMYTMLSHGEMLGERLQYLGGKLRNAGAKAVIISDRPSRKNDRQREEIAALRAALIEAEEHGAQCETYLDAALRIQRAPAEAAVRKARAKGTAARPVRN